jgi:dTDP-glucose 4,6-dehydratase
LGWKPEVPFEDGLAETVAWYRDNLEWLRKAHTGPIVTAPRGAPA